jgi:tetratricopeptide (TPR) repeat protein
MTSQVTIPQALQTALQHFQANNFSQAEAIYRQILEVEPNNPAIYTLLGEIYLATANLEEALVCYRQVLRFNPSSLNAYFRIGGLLTYQNHWKEAERYFHHSANLTTDESSQLGKIIYFNRKFYQTIVSSKLLAPGKVVEKYRKMDNFTHIVLVVCDLKYFYKYGLNYVNSFSHNADKLELLHLHIINPDAAFDQQLAHLLTIIKLDNFCVTTESVTFGNLSLHQQHTYYACARFVYLPHWLNYYQKPIVCTDIDAILEQSFLPLVEKVARHEVGLVRRTPLKYSPWLDIVANVVVAHPTPRVTLFFNLVRNYILHFYHRQEMYWHLDQIALFCVLKLLERFGEPPVVNWINEVSDQLIWQLGHAQQYEHKLQEERFTRYSLNLEQESNSATLES